MNTIYELLRQLRLPMQADEYTLHTHVMALLDANGVACSHEYKLAARCRVDVFCPESGTGIEIKRGKPDRALLLRQLGRYAACEEIKGLILVVERNVDLPAQISGKPVRVLCLNRLWGIAL